MRIGDLFNNIVIDLPFESGVYGILQHKPVGLRSARADLDRDRVIIADH